MSVLPADIISLTVMALTGGVAAVNLVFGRAEYKRDRYDAQEANEEEVQRLKQLIELLSPNFKVDEKLADIEDLEQYIHEFLRQERLENIAKTQQSFGEKLGGEGGVNKIKAVILSDSQQKSNDDSSYLLDDKQGSTVIELGASKEGYQIIQSLIRSGQLTNILGMPIRSVKLVDESLDDRQQPPNPSEPS
ncbi:hypothetical protein C7293_01435 [filamentous cyanobacterium CCT1]|nr:hypothetical protein C7293_01435 [filamentous cyanobacterium CCT1]PSN79834.1 hypothetical protein C8B47_09590 [filamentous cyanobacterium CCP4]